MQRFAYTGLLAAALVLASCFSGADRAGGAREASGAEAAGAVSPQAPPIDQRNPAITETATFALG